MLFINNIKQFLAEKSINKVLSSQERETHFPNYKSIKSILILFKSEENEKNPFIRKIISELKEEGKKVTVWGYVDKKEVETPILPDFRLFGNSEINFYDIPKSLMVNEFTHMQYDMVIQMTISDVIPLDYLMAKAHSPFKVSRIKPYKGIADFMIKINESEDDLFLYNQIMHYLKSIQAKN